MKVKNMNHKKNMNVNALLDEYYIESHNYKKRKPNIGYKRAKYTKNDRYIWKHIQNALIDDNE